MEKCQIICPYRIILSWNDLLIISSTEPVSSIKVLKFFGYSDMQNIWKISYIHIQGVNFGVRVTKTQNGKRNRMKNGMEKGMKQKTKWKIRRKTKYMNFVDTTAYKGNQFEIKQNLDF